MHFTLKDAMPFIFFAPTTILLYTILQSSSNNAAIATAMANELLIKQQHSQHSEASVVV